MLSICYNNCVEKNLQRLSKIKLLMINIIGKKEIFHQIKKIRKSLNQITKQLFLVSYMYFTILKK